MRRTPRVTTVLSLLSLGFVMMSFGAKTVRADDAAVQPIRALLVTGGCYHDYSKQKDILSQGISARANVQWTIGYDSDRTCTHFNSVYQKDEWANGYDVIVHDECSADVKDLAIIDRILKPHKDGIPAVVLHCSMHSYRSEGWPEKTTPWFELTGLATTGHGAQLPIEVTYLDKQNLILSPLADWTTIHEELYNNAHGSLEPTASALAKGKQTSKDKDGNEHSTTTVIAWTNIYNGKTRVFGTTLGHNDETVADARYLDLVTRGLLWSVNKLDDAHLKPAAKVLLDEPAAK